MIGAQEGEDVYTKTLKDLLQRVLHQGLVLAEVRQKRLRDILLDEFAMKADFAPAFIRVLLLPSDPVIQRKWARRARAEISDNPRLLQTLQKLQCDLTWMK